MYGHGAMAELLIQSLGCPNCGAPYSPNSRKCINCNITLVATSFLQLFGFDREGLELVESIKRFRQLLEREPGNGITHYALGILYLNSQFRDAAILNLRKASSLVPDYPDIHYNLAITLFNDGNLELASTDYLELSNEIERCLQIYPGFKEALSMKYTLNALGLKNNSTKQSVNEYRKAIDCCPDIAFIWSNLGVCFIKLNNYVEADKCFKQAISLNPKLAVAFSNLAYIMYQYNSFPLGLELGLKSISLMGLEEVRIHRADALNIISLCLWKLGRVDEATEYINRAVILAPNVKVYQQNLRMINLQKRV